MLKTQNCSDTSHCILHPKKKHWLGCSPEAHFIHMVGILAFFLDHHQTYLPLNSNRDS